MDFQEAFLMIYADAIMLILGVILAVGILIAMARPIIFIIPSRKMERPPEIDNE